MTIEEAIRSRDLMCRFARSIMGTCVVAIVVFCGAGPTSAAAAGVDHYLQTIDLPPQCPVSASDAPVCQLSPARPNSYQASGDQYILFRIGWSDSMRASCDAYASNTTVTIVVDGRAANLVTLPCQLVANFNGDGVPYWVTDARYLSPPLPPGTHTASATVVYKAPVPYWSGCSMTPPCYSKSGLADNFSQTVTVMAAAQLASPSPGPSSSPDPSAVKPSPSPAPAPSSSADRAGPANPLQSSLASALVAPAAAFGSLLSVAGNTLIAIGLVLFVTFPSLLFNHTYDENHARLQAWWDRRFGFTRRLHQSAQQLRSSRRSTASFAAVVILGAILGGLLDPGFGVNSRTAALVLGILLAIVAGAAVHAMAAGAYRRLRGEVTGWALRALPSGLMVAGLCVLVSRVTEYLPGYLYGVIGGVAFAGQLAKREEGHVVAVSSAAILLSSVVAWLLWVPVTAAASQPGAGFAWVLLENFLAAVFVSGLVGLVIGLVPLRFLPGEKLVAWHRGAWAGMFAVAAFALVQIMLRPGSATAHTGTVPFWTTLGLFLAFGAVSVGFWGYFRVRAGDLKGGRD
jgi:hypothetical protein